MMCSLLDGVWCKGSSEGSGLLRCFTVSPGTARDAHFLAMIAQTDRLSTALDGRYRILRHLGEGGMATVYLCEDLKHGRQLALKLLKPELAAERFVQEIKTTAALQHPHILPLFDSGAADGFLFYVMPFFDLKRYGPRSIATRNSVSKNRCASREMWPMRCITPTHAASCIAT